MYNVHCKMYCICWNFLKYESFSQNFHFRFLLAQIWCVPNPRFLLVHIRKFLTMFVPFLTIHRGCSFKENLVFKINSIPCQMWYSKVFCKYLTHSFVHTFVIFCSHHVCWFLSEAEAGLKLDDWPKKTNCCNHRLQPSSGRSQLYIGQLNFLVINDYI